MFLTTLLNSLNSSTLLRPQIHLLYTHAHPNTGAARVTPAISSTALRLHALVGMVHNRGV